MVARQPPVMTVKCERHRTRRALRNRFAFGALERGRKSSAIQEDNGLLAAGDGPVRTPALPPGSYRYRVGSGADTTGGRFDVGGPSAELQHAGAALPDSVPAPPRSAEEQGGRPLRTHPVPYLLLRAQRR